MVAYEIQHYLNRKSQGNVGYEQSLDIVEWNMLEAMMEKSGFDVD